MKRIGRHVLVAALVLLATAAGCTGNQRVEQPSPSPTPAATSTGPSGAPNPSVIATDQSSATSNVSPASVWATVEAKCTVCHTLQRVIQARKDWKGWNEAVQHMVTNGAELTPAERTAVVDYLADRSE